MPVLEAWGRLCRESEGQHLVELLGQYAPSWLVQLPWLMEAEDLRALQYKVMGATRERMLREMAQVVEALTVEKPLVLVLEDLQWSDYSTLELLSTLARRSEGARLLVIGTYRPVEVISRDHPLKGVKQELQLHGQCEELPLEFLTKEAVQEYLARRFVNSEFPAHLAQVIHRRTDGNPLFIVNVVEYLVRQGWIVEEEKGGRWELKVGVGEVEVGVPESLRGMIEQQISQVSGEERAALEAGSVAGVEFTAATVAAGVEAEVEAVERVCEGLVRRGQFIGGRGIEEWIAQTHRTVAAFKAMGVELALPYILGLLAEVCRRAGQAKEGLTVLAEALDLAHKNGERWYEAELHRLKGELLKQKAKTEAEAEGCFRQAINIARRQRAKSWELRATTSLARLWQQQGKKEEARQMLAEVYNWFTEGFDTPDLKEAKALLEELEGKATTAHGNKNKRAKKEPAHKTERSPLKKL